MELTDRGSQQKDEGIKGRRMTDAGKEKDVIREIYSSLSPHYENNYNHGTCFRKPRLKNDSQKKIIPIYF